MLLSEIKTTELSLNQVFVYANEGDERCQLIVEGLLDYLPAKAKKFIASVKPKLKSAAYGIMLASMILGTNSAAGATAWEIQSQQYIARDTHNYAEGLLQLTPQQYKTLQNSIRLMLLDPLAKYGDIVAHEIRGKLLGKSQAEVVNFFKSLADEVTSMDPDEFQDKYGDGGQVKLVR